MDLEDFKKWDAKEWRKNKTNKEWLRAAILSAEAMESPDIKPEAWQIMYKALKADVKTYLEALDQADANKGRGTSPRKAATSSANGKKGGRPKGSKNKPKDAAMYENLEALRSLPHAKHDDQADALALTAYMAKDDAKGA